MSSADPDFIIANGAIVKFVPDEEVKKGTLLLGQYADTLGRRMAYYEVRHRPTMTDSEYTEMIRRVKEIVR